ncbi:NAD(P)-dependent dehydrogenase (short-subunit alcohol dehydrogenase family) [Algoriphagus sp. 4150]|uniref:SDR family oxidoreductase n=1 Tax=Algoriphagus sp. 4150 TaxID=2817756 RepID=UPI002855BF00|nr:SDR family oxidoreductase [Algoriphagus sp. 4150]MDR7129729.1 NAD(P)-dependent dehydrogenase (short-subunit alcohol dehydrogenase family) [Algoriphagus sp. 4150]
METKKVWFVTGASKGLGLVLVKKLLANDYHVAATSRSVESLIKEIGNASDSFLPLEMDLTDNENVKATIAECIAHFGQIDVMVNNAGFGLIGTLEELSDSEVKTNFDVNVFGSLNVIRNILPHFRNQQSGHVFTISSIGGYMGNFPGFGIYCSTKFAVAGFTEALAEEMKPFNVHTTLVYPGYFRTNFLSKDSIRTAASPIAAYKSARELEKAHLDEINGNQPNDPEKAADVLITLSNEENPPVHFFMGKDAYHYAKQKLELIQHTMAAYETLAGSTEISNN